MSIVSDSSPLIAFESVGALDVLQRMYAEILVPPAVSREVFGAPGAPPPSWIRVQPLAAPIPEGLARAGMGPGETEAVALAVERSATLLIVDDLKARRLAQQWGLKITGVAGILLAAKTAGVIPAVAPALRSIADKGFRLSNDLIEAVLRRAGESAP